MQVANCTCLVVSLSCLSLAVSDAAVNAAPRPSLSPPSVPSGPPQNLAVSSRTTTSITLTWSDPAPDKINDKDGITGFEVRKNGLQVATVRDQNITFTGLRAAMSYAIEVLAINEQGIAPDNHAARLTATTASGGMHASQQNTCLQFCLSACCLQPILCHPLQYPDPQHCVWSSPGSPTPTWSGVTQSPLLVQSLVCRSAT